MWYFCQCYNLQKGYKYKYDQAGFHMKYVNQKWGYTCVLTCNCHKVWLSPLALAQYIFQNEMCR